MFRLSVADFRAFFSALWSEPDKPKQPFQWQIDLVEKVISGEENQWPEAIALPTASGKTACLDIAIFALAAQADRLGTTRPITAPRRIFFVVDRRIIVDEAYARAEKLADKLSKAEGGVLKAVADNLRLIAQGGTNSVVKKPPLLVFALRGGMYRSEAWARDPLQPIIVASTVDQVGSRMLFRAYGRGPGMWPVYAGLIANDSLILLDEAHCAQPFLQTMQSVKRYRSWAEYPLGRCFYPVVMSATPPPELEMFTDTSSERKNPDHPLGRRQLASKPAALVEVKAAKGAKGLESFVKALADKAEELISDERKAVVIFANRVGTARAVYELLCSRWNEEQIILLTGRMRPIDRDDTVNERLKLLASACSEERKLDEPLFVMATQTLEVGADLDFDGLVTECAALDALRQRFGRLNRMGRPIPARAVILIQGAQVDKSDDDPIYGSALAATWKWLKEQANDHGEVDFGISTMEQSLPAGADLSAMNTPAKNAPVMMPAHVDCFGQTRPAPDPDPDVALFLHGPRDGVADVQICWRADLELNSDAGINEALASLSLCPPSSSEAMPVPIGVFRRWLASGISNDDTPDVEGVDPTAPIEAVESGAPHLVIRWHGRDTTREDITSDPRRIRPGDVIVLPAVGWSWQELGDFPAAKKKEFSINPQFLDVGDRAYIQSRAKAILRIHPALVSIWPEGRAKELAKELLTKIAEVPDMDTEEVADYIKEILSNLSTIQPTGPFSARWSWLAKGAAHLLEEMKSIGYRRMIVRIGRQALCITGQKLLEEMIPQADTFSDEDDVGASGITKGSGEPVKLDEHLKGVAAFARSYAKGCGLSEELVNALEYAGIWHDLGKADPRYQALLRGGNKWITGGDLLAKSGDMRRTPQATRASRIAANYPENGRHELLSVRLIESVVKSGAGVPTSLSEDPTIIDLILHLVASHHGYCRPFAPVVFDDEAPDIELTMNGVHFSWQGPTHLERLDSGVSDRYWRLVKRFGWWGLAWLEALLRLADHRCSEWEETKR
ncbi:MAG TPA: type I-U CRISPR-associated helicase/endonuclease Cas3 [Firmicutes bacterium]|nr:type I-U CRISPR-associated helicase/endonuclease Cas3 [Bacillota bacterium]